MMKKYILMIFFLCGSLVWAQQKDSLIAESASVNVYKPKKVKPTKERISQLKLPSGFQIKKFAEDLGEPRILTVSPEGRVYVSRRNGDVMMLEDTNKDGISDKQDIILSKKGAHGLAILDDMLYVVTVKEVYRAPLKSDGTIGELEELIDDLPDGGQHPNRTIAFGPDGMMYITVGSTCNACAETNDENATVLRAETDGSNRKIFAKGLRNTLGFDWEPSTGDLFGMDHGTDWLGDNEQKEELNKIVEGADYGWPYIYSDGNYNKADEPKHMSWKEYAEKSTEPVMLFTAHSAPMAFQFYEGDMFPEEYRNAALVTFRGSWNRKPASGYKIMKVDFEDGAPVESEDFVTGFLTDNGTSHFARLVSLVEMPDGAVLVSDDTNGVIYRISYQD